MSSTIGLQWANVPLLRYEHTMIAGNHIADDCKTFNPDNIMEENENNKIYALVRPHKSVNSTFDRP